MLPSFIIQRSSARYLQAVGWSRAFTCISTEGKRDSRFLFKSGRCLFLLAKSVIIVLAVS